MTLAPQGVRSPGAQTQSPAEAGPMRTATELSIASCGARSPDRPSRDRAGPTWPAPGLLSTSASALCEVANAETVVPRMADECQDSVKSAAARDIVLDHYHLGSSASLPFERKGSMSVRQIYACTVTEEAGQSPSCNPLLPNRGSGDRSAESLPRGSRKTSAPVRLQRPVATSGSRWYQTARLRPRRRTQDRCRHRTARRRQTRVADSQARRHER